MYTIDEFRKSMRKAFNDAKEGHEVVVTRYDEKYQLVALVDKPLPGSQAESTPKGLDWRLPVNTTQKENEPEVVKSKLYPELQKNLCPHGKVLGKCFEVKCLTAYRMQK